MSSSSSSPSSFPAPDFNGSDYISQLLSSIGDALIVCDHQELIVSLNLEAQRMLGLDVDDEASAGIVLGTPVNIAFNFLEVENRQRISNILIDSIALGEAAQVQTARLMVDEKTELFIGYYVIDLPDCLYKALVLRDKSEDYVLQLRLQESENMQSLGRLTGGIAHDFNNMLGSIMGAAQILDVHLPDLDEKNREYIQIIMRVSEHAAELVRKLSAFSRRETVSKIDIEVNDLVKQVLSIAGHAINKRVALSSSAYKRDLVISGDPTALQSALLNMCINAEDAISQYGKLHVEIGVQYLEAKDWTDDFSHIVDGPYAHIAITDDGVGMDQETCSHIFEPFFTTKSRGKGTGLGLAAVYGTVKSHGGCLEVNSEKGEGSCFSIYLPLNERDGGSEILQTTDKKGRVILLVDDDESLRPVVRALLENLGYIVAEASNGVEAVHIYEDMRDRISLILLDLVMPTMTGSECFAAIRRIDSRAKFILISGFDRGADADAMLDQGALAYLRKPFKIHEMVKIIKDNV